MKAVVVVFPGTNRERDMAIALERATGRKPVMLFHRETALPAGTDLVVLPGGFSYGDYLRCGAMAAQSPIMREVAAFAQKGGHVLGVCNGFQVLCEAGLLPGALLRNASLRFLSMDCHMRVERAGTPYTAHWQQGAVFRAPMAHGDGNFFCDDETLARLNGENLVAFRYCTPEGQVTEAANRNGARNNIAGILSENLRVCGVMPHPEDLVDPLMGGSDGLPMFTSLVETVAA
ncbi:MAG TPA: phosphoribosylformylglycinamidine synthase subunit PurQ [Falsiroseomonas sp.]|jgi:phosphoribosylformylglycinamidine synthase|nr:phosphoribosylformylglycinamidine synthase subunit PurQ [Falsiroseomonas sp.]